MISRDDVLAALTEVEDLFEAWSREDMTEEGRMALLALGVT
jgi:hypothetical protein